MRHTVSLERGDVTDERPNAPTPRWVKILAIVALVLIAALVLLRVTTGGEHGPSRHSLGAPTVLAA